MPSLIKHYPYVNVLQLKVEESSICIDFMKYYNEHVVFKVVDPFDYTYLPCIIKLSASHTSSRMTKKEENCYID